LFGAPKSILILLYGDNEEIPYVSKTTLRPVFQTWESVYWVLPNTSVYDRDILVKMPYTDYSMKNFNDLLEEANLHAGIHLREKLEEISYESPGV
jgi:hypothetical protein